MATRSCVAVPQGDGWAGRYVHWDGYPEHMIPTLLDLIERKGLDRVIDVLINWNYGWSSLGAAGQIDVDRYADDRFTVVSDYGVAYSRSEQDNHWITDQNSEPLWHEFVYILGPKGITVLHSTVDENDEYVHRYHSTVTYPKVLV